MLLRCLRVLNNGNPVSKEMELLAHLEARWKSKLSGFDAVGNLHHVVGCLEDLLSRNAAQGRHENWTLRNEAE